MKKKLIPDDKQQTDDLFKMVLYAILAEMTLVALNFGYFMKETAAVLGLLIPIVWGVVAFFYLRKPLPLPKGMVETVTGVEDAIRLDIIYILQHVNIFDTAADPRYAAFIQKHLKEHTPQKEADIPRLIKILIPREAIEKDVYDYRNMPYILYMVAILMGVMNIAMAIMLLFVGVVSVLNLLIGIAFVAAGLVYDKVMKKVDSEQANLIFLFIGAGICAIIGGLFML